MAKATSEELVLITPQQTKLITETIETKLAVKNITDTAIQKYRDEALVLKINGPDDKAGYELVYKKRQEGKKTRILAAEICKAGREPLQAEVELWIKKQTEITISIKEVEAYLLGLEQTHEAAKQKIEDDKQAAVAERLKMRDAALVSLGARCNGVDYYLDEINFPLSLVKNSEDLYFNSEIVSSFQKLFAAKEEIRIAHEKAQAEFQAQQERERIEREKTAATERAALELEQTKVREERERLAQESARIEKEKNAEEHKRRVAAQKEADDKLKGRLNQLVSLGLKYDFNEGCYVNFGVYVPNLDITTKDNEEWEKMLSGISEHIVTWKKQEAEKEAARLEKEKQEAIDNAEHKRKAKEVADELKRKQDLELAGDKAKYAEVVAYLKATPIYEVRSGQYRSKMLTIRNFIDDLK